MDAICSLRSGQGYAFAAWTVAPPCGGEGWSGTTDVKIWYATLRAMHFVWVWKCCIFWIWTGIIISLTRQMLETPVCTLQYIALQLHQIAMYCQDCSHNVPPQDCHWPLLATQWKNFLGCHWTWALIKEGIKNKGNSKRSVCVYVCVCVLFNLSHNPFHSGWVGLSSPTFRCQPWMVICSTMLNDVCSGILPGTPCTHVYVH